MADQFQLVSQSVSQILGFQGQAAADTAAATGEKFAAQGATAEADAYGTAGGIAANNAVLQGVAGQIQEYQSQREVAKAAGSERADVGAAGFRMSGSNLSALRSSYQQGYLSDQLIRTQTNINEGGYLEQVAAAGGQRAAATASAGAATALGAAETTAAGTATTNAANETAALLGYIKSSGTTVKVLPGGPLPAGTRTIGGISGTPEGNLVTSTLSGNPALPATWNPSNMGGGVTESQIGGGMTENQMLGAPSGQV